MATAGNQQLRAQDPAPARRCDTEGRTGNQRRERRNGDRIRDGGGDEDGNGHEGRDGCENRSGNENEIRNEGGGEKEPGNLLSQSRGE